MSVGLLDVSYLCLHVGGWLAVAPLPTCRRATHRPGESFRLLTAPINYTCQLVFARIKNILFFVLQVLPALSFIVLNRVLSHTSTESDLAFWFLLGRYTMDPNWRRHNAPHHFSDVSWNRPKV